MDFQLTDVQRERIEDAKTFARDSLSPGYRQREKEEHFSKDLWDQAAARGLATLPIPEAYGGRGLGALDTTLVMEALGRSCEDSGLLFALCAHAFACAIPIWKSGTGEQKERFLTPLSQGDIAANAITEPSAGSDVYSMKTTATHDGTDYVLNGTKRYITNAPVADLFVAYALTKPDRGSYGISAFIVPSNTPGLIVEPGPSKTGLRTAAWGSVTFEDCRVPETQRLGPEGAGKSVFEQSMNWERGCLFATHVGAMERTLDQCVDHVQGRTQFEHPIGQFQSVANKLVDMKLRLETSRLLLYRAGWLQDEGRRMEAAEAASLSKLWISECSVTSGQEAIQIFGGQGVITESGVDALLRDSLPSRIYSGTSEIQRNVIAKHLGVR